MEHALPVPTSSLPSIVALGILEIAELERFDLRVSRHDAGLADHQNLDEVNALLCFQGRMLIPR